MSSRAGQPISSSNLSSTSTIVPPSGGVNHQVGMTSDSRQTPDIAGNRPVPDVEKGPNLPLDGGNQVAQPSTPVQNGMTSNGKGEDYWTVKWDGKDDPGDPLNTPTWRKWTTTFVLAAACVSVTCCSSMSGSTYAGLQAEFGVSEEICILTISLFVMGLGVGPMLLGPCSEFVGRSKVMYCAYGAFFLFNLPVAFANHIAIHLVFRFLTGFGGSAFLSVSGAVITDTFHNEKVGLPMMIWSAAPFLGPVLGPLLSGFINQNANWRWTYYVILIWAAVSFALILTFVRETYSSELLRRKAVRLRRETGEERWIAPVEKLDRTFIEALKKSIKTPIILLTTQPMVLLLDMWSALILGILYLFFGGVPFIFRVQHGFSLQQTGMSFLGIGGGQVIAMLTQPYFTKQYKALVKKHGGVAPPEERLRIGFYGAVLAPLGLILMGVTAYSNVPWIIPILCSSFFGMGMLYSYTATFTYLVDAYRPVAASALASNSFLRSSFAAGFPLFGQQMYRHLGAVKATCLLGGLMCLATPLPFIFFKIGARIRQRSPFGAT